MEGINKEIYYMTSMEIDLYNVRKPLESTAVELAAPHLSDESYLALLEEAERAEVELKKGNPDVFFAHDRHFHRTLISHSDNSRLIAIMDSLEVQVKWFGIIMTKNLDRPYRAIEMHKSIVHAMRDNKIDEARQLMELHIEEVKQDIMSDFPKGMYTRLHRQRCLLRGMPFSLRKKDHVFSYFFAR